MDRNKLNCVLSWHIIVIVISFFILPRLFIGPGAPPQNVIGYNTSSTSINVTWNEVPEDKQNGDIIRYTVMYNKTTNVINKSEVTQISEKVLELKGLDKYTIYDIRVLAATKIGDGPASDPMKVQTDEDSE